MSSKMRLTRLLVLIVGTATVGWGAQTPQGKSLEFAVLRTDRVVVWVPTGESARLNCSIIGLGKMAQMNCHSYTVQNGFPRVCHTALVVGSNGVG